MSTEKNGLWRYLRW